MDCSVDALIKPGAEIHGYEPTPPISWGVEGRPHPRQWHGLAVWFEQFLSTVDVPHTVPSAGIDTLDIATRTLCGSPAIACAVLFLKHRDLTLFAFDRSHANAIGINTGWLSVLRSDACLAVLVTLLAALTGAYASLYLDISIGDSGELDLSGRAAESVWVTA